MARFSGLSKAVTVSGFALLALTACAGSEAPEEIESPTSSQSPTAEQTQKPVQGETLEIQHHLRMQVPDGWMALTEDIPGLDIYILMVVPADADQDELELRNGWPEFAYLTVMDFGAKAKNGAERYSAAAMEEDAENSSAYSDVTELEPRRIGDTTFYGYEGVLARVGKTAPFQYWHADANGVTYKVEIHADNNGDIPAELEDAFNSLEFER
ncbi:hypothetical protein QP228_000725 [Pseudoglutamicibacter cumminsii]|uniref:hypothetical protein n=1 Tax=Pseudoglutamicibacter cumminsii TaxID=156979 RepID=UPI0025524434|nr:hypothetical protein [Pseudoglutamicibacter cumminsii]MDZ3744552.1 hypothetical protein [Pseudoglutamicibacter cumminsii]